MKDLHRRLNRIQANNTLTVVLTFGAVVLIWAGIIFSHFVH